MPSSVFGSWTGSIRARPSIPRAFRLRGQLDVEALGRGLDTIQERHEVLRTVFRLVDGNPVQFVEPLRAGSLTIVDLSSLPEGARGRKALGISEEEARTPFDLARGPLLRTTLLRLDEQEHILIVNAHHIVWDGWSADIFDRELSVLYQSYKEGRASPVPPLPIQYADFAVWQREWLRGGVLEEQLSYWRRRLKGAPAGLDLRATHSRPAVQTSRGATETISISGSVADAVRLLGQREGASLFMTLLAAFQVLLHRHSGQEDILVGSPVAGRNRGDIEGLIGFFVNTLVLRSDLSGDPTFRDLLRQVREVAFEAFAHQDLPFERLVEELNPERTLSRSPLFQVMMVLQNAPAAGLCLSDVSVAPFALDTATSKFDLTALFEETGKEIAVSFEYNTDLFDVSTVRRMLSHLELMLAAIAECPDRRLSELPLLTAQERHQLLVEWNDTAAAYPRGSCIHELFEAQVSRTPEAEAVILGSERLSYGQLNERANRLARHLRKRGVGSEVLVGLCVERSLEMVVALLGILKAGGAYVPLDPGYPRRRLSFMLEDTAAPVVLTQESLSAVLPEGPYERVRLDADWPQIARESAEDLPIQGSSEDLAYVIYTSGSTGTPKGISIRHRSVVRLVRGVNYATFGPEEVFLQFAPISFDASTFEIWGALLNGSRLALMPPGIPSLTELGEALKNYGVSTLWLTAGLFHHVVDTQIESLRGVRQLLAGGDTLSVPHVEKVLRELPNCRLINGYGPTENTTFTCCHTVRRDDSLGASVPIGRPIANTRVFILDRNRQPVPVGVPGELYAGGDGLAREYFRRPDLTAERFVPDPFAGGQVEQRLYRTGDRARYRADGTIEFLGRIDDQVKIRGFRIELGEIESALAAHTAVSQVAAAVREEPPGESRLIAYIVPKGRETNPGELRGFLESRLPSFMLPSRFVFVDALPMSPTGKVDRKALAGLSVSRSQQADVFVPPRTAVEETIARLWSQVLGIERIGVHDNFFDLGGHSLLAARLIAEIENKLHRRLALATIFRAPTVAELSGILQEKRRSKGASPSLMAIQPKGTKPPFFCVHAIGGVFYYQKLARHLGPDQPFYGLQSQGLDGRRSPYETVEEMAAHYIREIRELLPEGPYFLGGHSLGGKVAFEMARQLHDQGQRVAFLALFDTVSAPLSPDPEPRRLQFVRDRARFHTESLRKVEPKQRVGYLLDRAETVAQLALRALSSSCARALSLCYEAILDPLRRAQRRVLEANYRAAVKYVPRFYAGRATIFRAKDHTRTDVSATDWHFGWSTLCGEGVEVHETPGDHASILEDEMNIRALAEKLSECLRKARQTESRRIALIGQSSGSEASVPARSASSSSLLGLWLVILEAGVYMREACI